MKISTFKFSEDTLRQIDELKESTGLSSRSEVIRQAIKRWHDLRCKAEQPEKNLKKKGN